MLERISKARKALLPYHRTIELARAYEYGAYGVAAAHLSEDCFSVDKPLRCHKSQWKTPRPTKDDVAAIDQYCQKSAAFEDLFHQAKQIYLVEPKRLHHGSSSKACDDQTLF